MGHNIFFKLYLIRHYDQKDYQLAALLTILKYFGGNTSLPHLQEFDNVSLQCSTMLDIINVFNKLDFKAIVASGGYKNIIKEGRWGC